ncbi:MAG: DUF5995 family protein [Actinobacteria bacterium]|nr:DUF5995 family protein [Actinomycetota bacterium]
MVDGPPTIADVVARMDRLLAPLEAEKDERRHFLATYRRTTIAVGEEVERGGFLDGAWVELWDVAVASMYLDALEQWDREGTAPGPWAVAFEAARSEDLPPVRHTLLGMNAHINYDLPQALLAVITDMEFTNPDVIARRALDHGHIDAILVTRVPEEDKELLKVEEPGDRSLLDRLLTPFNQAGTKRFLREARGKVWHNASLLSAARVQGEEALAARVAELEELAKARVADLRAPGQVLLRLARHGFGVELDR